MTKNPRQRYVNLPTREQDKCRMLVLKLRGLIEQKAGHSLTGPEVIRVALDEAIARRAKP